MLTYRKSRRAVRNIAGCNRNSNVATHHIYDSFGKVTSQTQLGGTAVDCLFGYAGKAFDRATGLQNNLNRWYDPSVGTWLSEDPAAADENLYRYAGNGPTDGTDPSGTAEINPPVPGQNGGQSMRWTAAVAATTDNGEQSVKLTGNMLDRTGEVVKGDKNHSFNIPKSLLPRFVTGGADDVAKVLVAAGYAVPDAATAPVAPAVPAVAPKPRAATPKELNTGLPVGEPVVVAPDVYLGTCRTYDWRTTSGDFHIEGSGEGEGLNPVRESWGGDMGPRKSLMGVCFKVSYVAKSGTPATKLELVVAERYLHLDGTPYNIGTNKVFRNDLTTVKVLGNWTLARSQEYVQDTSMPGLYTYANNGTKSVGARGFFQSPMISGWTGWDPQFKAEYVIGVRVPGSSSWYDTMRLNFVVAGRKIIGSFPNLPGTTPNSMPYVVQSGGKTIGFTSGPRAMPAAPSDAVNILTKASK